MPVFHVTFKCRPEQREVFLEKLKAEGIIAACREEAGNLSYDYYLTADDPDELLLIEKWKDMDALMAHAKQTHMARMDALKAEYVTDMKIEMLREVQGPG